MIEKATFGGGCFWCIEPIFKELKGVQKVTSGYAGGTKENPTYEEVSAGNTNHAEVIQIEFDSDMISFKDLLYVFFRVHDPTTLNRQGNDVGTQYRSIILYANAEQKNQTEDYLKILSSEKLYDNPIVTEIKELEKFYPAEDYHQNFYENNQSYPYCQIIIEPKLLKFRKEIKERFS